MKNNAIALTHPVRLPVVGKYIGQLLLVLALLTVVPLVVALVFGDYTVALSYTTILVLQLAISVPASRMAAPTRIQANEALVITVLAFVVSPLLMTYPIAATGLSFEDALFEAVSAITTTGLTTVTDLQTRPVTFLFARAWMQWYGGLGIVVLSIALLMGHHLAARQLARPLSTDTMAVTARTHARRMLIVYVSMTLIGLLILWLITGSVSDGLLYVLTAVSTGGFAPHDASLAAFENLHVRYAIILIALCGAVPLPLYYLAWRKRIGEFFGDNELLGLLALVVSVSILLVAFRYANSGLDLGDCIADGVLLGISAQTGTGFSSQTVADLDDGSKLVTIIAMLIGGGMGSTAGGIKVLRLLILLRLVHLLMLRTALPSHAVVTPHLGDKPLEEDDVQRALLVILLFAVVVLVSWLIFVVCGFPPLDALFEVASATGTVGLTTGLTHSDLPSLLKLLLCFDMLLGRVEIVALLIILYPRTWIGKRAGSA